MTATLEAVPSEAHCREAGQQALIAEALPSLPLRLPNGPTPLFVALDQDDQEVKLNRVVAALGRIPKVLDFQESSALKPKDRPRRMAFISISFLNLVSFCSTPYREIGLRTPNRLA